MAAAGKEQNAYEAYVCFHHCSIHNAPTHPPVSPAFTRLHPADCTAMKTEKGKCNLTYSWWCQRVCVSVRRESCYGVFEGWFREWKCRRSRGSCRSVCVYVRAVWGFHRVWDGKSACMQSPSVLCIFNMEKAAGLRWQQIPNQRSARTPHFPHFLPPPRPWPTPSRSGAQTSNRPT